MISLNFGSIGQLSEVLFRAILDKLCSSIAGSGFQVPVHVSGESFSGRKKRDPCRGVSLYRLIKTRFLATG